MPKQAVEVNHGPSEQQLRSCLKDHGIDVPGNDPAALKRWIGEHQDDAAAAAALKACNVGPVTKTAAGACRTAGPVTATPTDKADTGRAPDVQGAATAGT
jgi:hypothetical protein